ncbi:hypothetical protein QBC47DRAFT_52869 [Echria macrotheca]|uniref:Uncharacterized protein n=1 Tax=Echria macrotheca TaxID=438768 RepID=A0AAJ0B7J0_9PEZI|nr:hypothetical protein QBC47DRAFT_52869 [Echria macrotheca]
MAPPTPRPREKAPWSCISPDTGCIACICHCHCRLVARPFLRRARGKAGPGGEKDPQKWRATRCPGLSTTQPRSAKWATEGKPTAEGTGRVSPVSAFIRRLCVSLDGVTFQRLPRYLERRILRSRYWLPQMQATCQPAPAHVLSRHLPRYPPGLRHLRALSFPRQASVGTAFAADVGPERGDLPADAAPIGPASHGEWRVQDLRPARRSCNQKKSIFFRVKDNVPPYLPICLARETKKKRILPMEKETPSLSDL